MTLLQFSLFFIAIVVAYALVHMRLVKFESYLKELTELRQLNERLKAVADAMERVNVERLEEGLQLLHEDAKDVSELAEKMDRKLTQSRGERVAATPDVTGGERILAAVEERLFQLGYQKLRILTDVRHVRVEDEVEIQVECEKRMMPYKGKVVARNGAIVDVDIHSVVGMFP